MRKLHELNDLLKRVPLLAHVVLVIGDCDHLLAGRSDQREGG
jgi:hypothetical protein